MRIHPHAVVILQTKWGLKIYIFKLLNFSIFKLLNFSSLKYWIRKIVISINYLKFQLANYEINYSFWIDFSLKEKSLYHKLWFSIIPISEQPNAIDLFQTMSSVLSNNLSLKCQSLSHQIAKIKGLESLSLWQRLNFLFVNWFFLKLEIQRIKIIVCFNVRTF